jgi:hypothetical protein
MTSHHDILRDHNQRSPSVDNVLRELIPRLTDHHPCFPDCVGRGRVPMKALASLFLQM